MATQSKACNTVGGDGRLYRWPTLHLKWFRTATAAFSKSVRRVHCDSRWFTVLTPVHSFSIFWLRSATQFFSETWNIIGLLGWISLALWTSFAEFAQHSSVTTKTTISRGRKDLVNLVYLLCPESSVWLLLQWPKQHATCWNFSPNSMQIACGSQQGVC